jgi:hypothetical protein
MAGGVRQASAGVVSREAPPDLYPENFADPHDLTYHKDPDNRPPATMDDIPIAFKPFKADYEKLQAKFNVILAGATIFFIATLGLALADDTFAYDVVKTPANYRNNNYKPSQ